MLSLEANWENRYLRIIRNQQKRKRGSVMAFPDSVVTAAWDRAGGSCECRRISHPKHLGRNCDKQFVWTNRGRGEHGAWEAHHKIATDGDTLSNCEILCWDRH